MMNPRHCGIPAIPSSLVVRHSSLLDIRHSSFISSSVIHAWFLPQI